MSKRIDKMELAVEKIRDDFFKVKSGENEYYVTKIDGEYACTCKGWWYHNKCKHIEMVKRVLNEN